MKNEKVKITGIKKAVGDYKKTKHNLIYYDISAGYVWTNEYSDCNSYTIYDDDCIILINKIYFDKYDKMNMKNLNEFLEKKLYKNENELF